MSPGPPTHGERITALEEAHEVLEDRVNLLLEPSLECPSPTSGTQDWSDGIRERLAATDRTTALEALVRDLADGFVNRYGQTNLQAVNALVRRARELQP